MSHWINLQFAVKLHALRIYQPIRLYRERLVRTLSHKIFSPDTWFKLYSSVDVLCFHAIYRRVKIFQLASILHGMLELKFLFVFFFLEYIVLVRLKSCVIYWHEMQENFSTVCSILNYIKRALRDVSPHPWYKIFTSEVYTRIRNMDQYRVWRMLMNACFLKTFNFKV